MENITTEIASMCGTSPSRFVPPRPFLHSLSEKSFNIISGLSDLLGFDMDRFIQKETVSPCPETPVK